MHQHYFCIWHASGQHDNPGHRIIMVFKNQVITWGVGLQCYLNEDKNLLSQHFCQKISVTWVMPLLVISRKCRSGSLVSFICLHFVNFSSGQSFFQQCQSNRGRHIKDESKYLQHYTYSYNTYRYQCNIQRFVLHHW